MNDVHYYNTEVRWEQGRRGTLTAPDMSPIIVATPPEFPKGEPYIWSPEHLYVASANSCLMTTFLAIADNSNLEFVSFDSIAAGKLEKIDGKFLITEIELKPKVILKHEKDRDRAIRILHKAEEACLISNSMKSKTVLLPEVIIAE
jgi:organic hydroperoxide reductase OsmC/OhrA